MSDHDGLPPLRLTGVFETTGGWSLQGGSRDNPLVGGFYPNDGVSPNGEAVLQWRPVDNVSAVIDLGFGPNFRATQPSGLTSGAPFDPVQMYTRYCPGIFCIGGGRFLTGMGYEVIRADQNDFIFRGPKFYRIPYTETGGEIQLGNDTARFTVRVTPGPDRVQDNNGFPYFHTNLTLNPAPVFSLFANYQFGPEQDNNTQYWRHTADLGIGLNPSSSIGYILYGLYGAESTQAGGWRQWGGVDLVFRARPENGPVGFYLRTGATHDDGIWNGLAQPMNFAQFGGGLSVFVADILQIRLQVDLLAGVDGLRPFNGNDVLPRIGLQMVFGHSVDVGLQPSILDKEG